MVCTYLSARCNGRLSQVWFSCRRTGWFCPSRPRRFPLGGCPPRHETQTPCAAFCYLSIPKKKNRKNNALSSSASMFLTKKPQRVLWLLRKLNGWSEENSLDVLVPLQLGMIHGADLAFLESSGYPSVQLKNSRETNYYFQYSFLFVAVWYHTRSSMLFVVWFISPNLHVL